MSRPVLTTQDLQEVLSFIPVEEKGGSPISAPDLGAPLGLTKSQVYRRIERMRDTDRTTWTDSVTGEPTTCPVITETDGYLVTNNPDRIRGFLYRRTKRDSTSGRRTFNEVVTHHMASLPEAERKLVMRRFGKQLTRLVEDMDELIASAAP